MTDDLLQFCGADPGAYLDDSRRFWCIDAYLRTRRCLVVLDDCDARAVQQPVVQLLVQLPVPVVCVCIGPVSDWPGLRPYRLAPFTVEEYLAFARTVLGEPYVDVYQQALGDLGEAVGLLPALAAAVLRQVRQQPAAVVALKEQFQRGGGLLSLEYDGRRLEDRLVCCMESCSSEEQLVLMAGCLFRGRSFSAEAVAYATGLPPAEVEDVLGGLVRCSYVAGFPFGRFALHPVMKQFLLQRHAYRRRFTHLPVAFAGE